jgi:hypothetical protein
MKSNNLRYINEFLGKDSKETVKEEKRTASTIKSNNIYKDSARKHEEEGMKESTKAKPEEDYDYRVPTFKGLAEEIENNKKKRTVVYLEP